MYDLFFNYYITFYIITTYLGLMDLRTAYCTNFYEFSVQNTMQRNERLAKMLAKHKKYCSKDNINPYHS